MHSSESSEAESGDTFSEPEIEPLQEEFPVRVGCMTRSEALPYSCNRTGLVYDARMRFHTEIHSIRQAEHDVHPEDPRRLFEIYKELVDAGLVHVDYENPEQESDHHLKRIEAYSASKKDVCLIHCPDHYEWVENLQHQPESLLYELGTEMDSIYLHQATYSCALLAVGGAIEACRKVVTGEVKNAIAIIRPPGHHASQYGPAGFCFFNNVSIAAKVCQRDYPEKCRKILILDWDVHHGNGVQAAFYDDPNVLYISIHVHQNGTFYPVGPYGNHLHCGENEGLGYTVNIPWSENGKGDADYIFAFQRIVMPISTQFDPDLVIVAAGFDSAEGDTLGGCFVSPGGFAQMTHILMTLAGGKVVACLEGGYNLRSIARSALAVTKTLMGEPPDRITSTVPSRSAVKTVDIVARTQSTYWSSVYPKRLSRNFDNSESLVYLHEVVRGWQRRIFWEKLKMTPLFILRDGLSKTFENQVLATKNFNQPCPLLVVFHDPPVILGVTDPQTNEIDLHQSTLTDPTVHYIEWALNNGFSIIDVNLPRQLPGIDTPQEKRIALRELASYLWDNYIEVYERPHIFLMGTGEANYGIIDLVSNHENAIKLVSGIISFVATSSLEAVRRSNGESIANWYHSNSRVFVSLDHYFWALERLKKPRKKYGKLIRLSSNSTSEMLQEALPMVIEYLDQETRQWQIHDKAMISENHMPLYTSHAGATKLEPANPEIIRDTLDFSPTLTSWGADLCPEQQGCVGLLSAAAGDIEHAEAKGEREASSFGADREEMSIEGDVNVEIRPGHPGSQALDRFDDTETPANPAKAEIPLQVPANSSVFSSLSIGDGTSSVCLPRS